MNTLHYLELSGSPLALGEQLGRFGAPITHHYLVHSPAWASVMQWKGSEVAEQLRHYTQTHFPAIYDEIRGLAIGLQLPEDDVFLWNCRGDLWAMAPDGCTTVMLPGQTPRLTHNEDGDPGFAGHCGVARITPDSGPAFVSFVYPASIPGHTFAVNQHGLALTVNNLRCINVRAGLPRMVLARAMLTHHAIEHAVAMLENLPRAGGFHFGLGQAGRPQLLSVEFCSGGVSQHSLHAPTLHANHATHPSLAALAQRVTASSQRRQARGDLLLTQQTPSPDPLQILADQNDAAYPIYRNAPDDSDQENTLATADFHLESDGVQWAVYSGQAPQPCLRFQGIDRRETL